VTQTNEPMVPVVDQLRELKTQAKNRRDLKRYERAAHFADQAIALARKELLAESGANYKAQLASELADSYGLLGGIERRWGAESDDPALRREHYQASVRAYDQGYEVESDPRYGLVNSYCLLNRLVGRVLLNPELLALPATADAQPDAGGGGLDLVAELEQAGEHIEEQLATERYGDYWVIADLALINLLLARADARTAYAPFNAQLPPDFAYKSVIETLRCVAAAWVSDASRWREAIDELEEHARRRSLLTN
jgi:hypothetical protein